MYNPSDQRSCRERSSTQI